MKEKKLIYTVNNLVKHLKEGNQEGKDLVIPEYQRDYVWNEGQIPLLIDSMYRGYPIGAIVTWEDLENNKIHLLDGLQRSFSIIKITNNFDAYINDEIIKISVEKANLKETTGKFDKLFSKKNEVETRIEEIATLFSEKTLDEVIEELYDVVYNPNVNKITKENLLINELIYKGLNNLKEFKETGIYEYEIDRIEIDNKFRKIDVTRIFERLNSEGKELNNFEIYASIWSNFDFKLKEEYLKNFKIERKKKYANAIGIELDSSPYSPSSNITPSDYVYATLILCLKKTKYLKDFFVSIDANGNETLRNIEELSSLFLNYFDLNTEKENFKKLGEKIKFRFENNPSESKLFRETLENSMKIVEDNLTIFNFARANTKDYGTIKKTLNISSHLIISMINQVVNKTRSNEKVVLHENQLNFWMLHEMIKKVYGSTSAKKGEIATADNRYIKSSPKKLSEKIIAFIRDEEEKQLKSISNATKLLLAFLQQGLQLWSSENLHIDHIIPQSKLKEAKIKYRVHSLYNLQLLGAGVNIDKDNIIDPSNYQFDSIIKHKIFLEESLDAEYFQVLVDVKTNVATNYDHFYKFRKNIVERIIKETFK